MGLIFSNGLTRDQHIEKACKKAIGVFILIKRNVFNHCWRTKFNLYISMIVPILVYGSSCYGLKKFIMTEMEKRKKRTLK